jgi:anthranilate synthase component 1
MVGLAPDLVWRCEAGTVSIDRAKASAAASIAAETGTPLESLRRLMAESALPLDPGLPPMAAGLFGYLGYDMVRSMEALGPRKPDSLGVPDGMFVRPTLMVVFDAVRDELFLIAPVRPHTAVPAKAALESVGDLLDAAADALEAALPAGHEDSRVPPSDGALRSNVDTDSYAAMVVRAKEYIAAGDIFQVVLSQRYEAPFPLSAIALYRALRRVNPAPFLCYLDFESFQIVCSSPEILVRVRRGDRDGAPDRGHPPPWLDSRRGCPARGGAPGGREGTRRAPHAARSGPKRRRARLRDRVGRGDRQLLPRALQPRHAHRVERRGTATA